MGGDQLAEIVRIGTRGSRLALAQAELAMAALRAHHSDVQFTVTVMNTPADRSQDRPISAFGDKGVFVRTLEAALLDGAIDLAVHSLKDVPGDVDVPGLCLVAFLPREDPLDVLVTRTGGTLRSLPDGAVVGTSSLRRRTQLRLVRPDLQIREIRGNVDTRLRKVRDGDYDAIVLAAAGLKRLGLADAVSQTFTPEELLPDAGQGIIAIQAREGSTASRLARAADDSESRTAACAERAVVRALGAGCRSPVGALAEIGRDSILLRALSATEDGSRIARRERQGGLQEPEALGKSIGEELRAELAALGQTYTER